MIQFERMLKSSKQPITLTINGTDISFNGLAEFEFALGGRTNVPATKLTDLIMLSPENLKREAKNIRAIEKRFDDILARSLEHPGEIGRLVREIDIQVFSNDYDWRNIFKALNQQSEDCDDLRRIAVAKYTQYLRSRQDVIKQTYNVKSKEVSRNHESASSNNGRDAAGAPDDINKDLLKETSIFESVSLEVPLEQATTPLTRLPKGEAIRIRPQPDTEFLFKLSKYSFIFRNRVPLEIVDELGNVYGVKPGKNIVGRDSVCNIVVATSLRDISRMHLIIEPQSDGLIRLTDLSSHGTFLPSSLVPELSG
jgi:FHA domain